MAAVYAAYSEPTMLLVNISTRRMQRIVGSLYAVYTAVVLLRCKTCAKLCALIAKLEIGVWHMAMRTNFLYSSRRMQCIVGSLYAACTAAIFVVIERVQYTAYSKPTMHCNLLSQFF